MPSSESNDLDVLVQWPREERHLEFKRSMSWAESDTKSKLVKSVLAMANLRDGGHIVLGVELQPDDSYKYVGMETDHAASYVQDDLSAYFSEYADPYVEVSLIKHLLDGKVFCILRIAEFSELPVICKRDGPGDLRRGALYVRSRRQVETVAIPSQVEMRELLDLAVEKRNRAFALQARRMGYVTVPNVDRFAEQLKTLPIGETINKIRSLGYWRFWIRPSTFEKARFQDIDACRTFMLLNEVRTTDGWQFPIVRKDRIIEGREYITSERDFTADSLLPLPHIEVWTLFRSGQFVYNLALVDDLWKADPQRVLAGRECRLLNIRLALKVVTCIFEFAARMASANVLDPEATVQVELHNVDGRELAYMDSQRALDERYWSRNETIAIERTSSPDDLRTRARELALDVSIDIFKRFGWENPPRQLLAEDQARFMR